MLLVLESQKPILETKNLLPKVFQERVYHLQEGLFCIWLEMIKPEDVQVLAQEMNLGHVGLACTLKHPHSRLLEFAKKSLERAEAEGSIVSSEPSYEFWQRGLV